MPTLLGQFDKKQGQLDEVDIQPLDTRPLGYGRNLHGNKKDGCRIPLWISLNLLQTYQGKFVVASVVDITERIRSQTELQTNNQKN